MVDEQGRQDNKKGKDVQHGLDSRDTNQGGVSSAKEPGSGGGQEMSHVGGALNNVLVGGITTKEKDYF